MIDLHCHILPGVDDGSASEADSLRRMGVDGAFSGEREVALSMSRFLLDDLGVGRTGLEAELERVREVFDEGPATQQR